MWKYWTGYVAVDNDLCFALSQVLLAALQTQAAFNFCEKFISTLFLYIFVNNDII